jgi:tetratricopeptide (TPR) repeat protein
VPALWKELSAWGHAVFVYNLWHGKKAAGARVSLTFDWKMAPKFLSRLGLFTLGVVFVNLSLLVSAYYATLRPEATLTIGVTTLDVEQSKKLAFGLQYLVGTAGVAFIIGVMVTEFMDWRKEKSEPEPIPPPPQKPKSKPLAADQKFYPRDFLPDLKYFTGRKDLLQKLAETLRETHRAAIHNYPGLGKTFSACKYAADHCKEYKKIFFINAAKDSYLESLAEAAAWLDPEVAKIENQQEQAKAFKNWQEQNDGWLAIYDNVDEPAELKEFVPTNRNGDCIFTSNSRAVSNLGAEVEIVKLAEAEARALLFARANTASGAVKGGAASGEPVFQSDAERDAFANIIAEIDGLPIALVTTGAVIAARQLSFADYANLVRQTPEAALGAEDDFDRYHKRSARKAFSIALDEMAGAQKGDSKEIGNEKSAVREILTAAALVAPDDIPEEFLQNYLQKNMPGFEPENIDQWSKIRSRFTSFELFSFNQTTRLFSTHRLAQKTILTRANEKEIKQTCEKVLNLLRTSFPNFDFQEGEKEKCERYYQHCVTALENAGKAGFAAEVSADLYNRTAMYQWRLGNYGQAEELYQRALARSRQMFGEEHENTATSLNNLAAVYDNQGKYDEAIKLYKEAKEITRKALGKEHPAYAASLNNLAMVYYNQGKYDAAIKLYKDAIEIGEKTIGKEHPNYAASLNNLAMVYKAQGKYDAAIGLYKEATEITGKALGKEHPDYATSLNNLAAVYDNQGKYDAAIGLYKEATEITGKALGKEHPDYATSLNNLAWVYRNQEKYSEALPLYEAALRIFEVKLPPGHEYIADVKMSIANCKESRNSNTAAVTRPGFRSPPRNKKKKRGKSNRLQ